MDENSIITTSDDRVSNLVITYDQLKFYLFPLNFVSRGGCYIFNFIPAPFSTHPNSIYNQNYLVHVCVRCNRLFYMTPYGDYLTHEQCQYHWGKLHHMGNTSKYTCCNGPSESNGCSNAQYHVWNGLYEGWNGPLAGYRQTSTAQTHPSDGDFGVYALDCEMCYTANGLEVTKVTVVTSDGQVVYDFFVMPEQGIIDYNTRFSGITQENFSDPNYVKTLNEVQNDLLSFINENSILIGHGLNNDLRALKIVHYRVIDTAILFPHPHGFPYQNSLKRLAQNYLRQPQIEGKAQIALQLVRYYLTNMYH